VEEDEELRATLALYKSKKKTEEEMSIAETEEGDDEAPHVDMDELLDDFDELTVEDRQMHG
jgi:nonsense-mediated mRNA decay protein 3